MAQAAFTFSPRVRLLFALRRMRKARRVLNAGANLDALVEFNSATEAMYRLRFAGFAADGATVPAVGR
jgi:hypothetical protein